MKICIITNNYMLYLTQSFKFLEKLPEACAVANARTNTISVTQTDLSANYVFEWDNIPVKTSYHTLISLVLGTI